ncbi:MAG: hypothetical protein DCF13_04450 [Flavobacteriaceae bacterium]|nr:MAG: hypothetical protein DCF13_04450 [Flavobacteriaceae bacterium]
MGNTKLSWTVKLSIIGLLLLLINFFVIGGGHGYFELLFITFPYPCLLLNIFDEINLFGIFLFLIQYPIYGYFLDKNCEKIKSVTLSIIITHLIFSIIAYQNMPISFK